MNTTKIWACTECSEVTTTLTKANEHVHTMKSKNLRGSVVDFITHMSQTPWVSALDVIEESVAERRAMNRLKSRI